MDCIHIIAMRICSEPFLFPLLLYGSLSMLSAQEGAERGEGGLCFQGDENTRLYTAAAVLCNWAVTMTTFKGLKEEGEKSSQCLRVT